MEEYTKANEIIIGEKDYKLYVGICIVKFRTCDQIYLSAVDAYQEKMQYVAELLNGVGIEPEKGYVNPLTGKIVIQREILNDVIDKKSGKRRSITINKLGLTKVPELYRFTDLKNKPLEVNGR